MAFEKLLYQAIGRRIKQYRKSLGYTQEEFVEEFQLSGVSLLSKIENGKVSDRNPHLLPKSFMPYIKECYDKNNNKISPRELIWGTSEEQERLVQILLLSILMNDSTNNEGKLINPFFYSDNYKELFPWAKCQKPISQDLLSYLCTACAIIEEKPPINPDQKCILPAKTIGHSSDKDTTTKESISINELMSSVQEYFKETYGFFFDKNSYDMYEMLQYEHDKETEQISNMLLKSILNELNFAQSFIMRLSNTFWNKPWLNPDNSYTLQSDIDNFIAKRGNYGELILDYKQTDYYLFINAFHIFWKKKKKMYMQYFEKNLFDEKFYIEGLGKLTSEHIKTICEKQGLKDLIQLIENLDMYYEEDAIISNYYQQLTLQELPLRAKMLTGLNEYDTSFYNYIKDMKEITWKYIQAQYSKPDII